MYIPEKGVQENSSFYFFTPGNLAKSMFFYMISAGDFYCNEDYHVQRDNYNSFLIMFVKKGRGTVSFSGRNYPAAENDVVLLNCHQPHAYYTNSGWETLWIHFDGNTSRQFFDLIFSRSGCVISLGASVTIPRYLNMIMDGFKHSKPSSEPIISCYIQRMLTELLLLSSSFSEEKPNKINPVFDAITYIDENFKRKITLQIVASHVNLSPFHFSRLFKKETGYSPYEYILIKRIDHAKFLLKKANINIKEIAYESGFSSESNFIYLFHNTVGSTPGEFRNTPI